MKTLTTQLSNLLKTRQWMYASLFQFNLVNGNTLYYAAHENDILWGGNTYSSGGQTGPYFDQEGQKCKMKQDIGTGAQQFQVTVMPVSATLNGQSYLSALRSGVFDGAELIYSGAYWAQGTNENQVVPVVPVGVVTKMVGRVAEVGFGRNAIIITANDHTELFNQQMPRNLYQSPCANALFDAGCTLNKASYAVSGTVSNGSTASLINSTLSQATGYFDLGTITFTSGINNGVTRSIKTYIQGSPGTIAMFAPFPSAPSAGDSFTIYPGCKKDIPTCTNTFNNLIHFRGTPFIPTPDTAI